MKESNCPLALWDCCVEQRARINNLTAKDSFKLNGTTLIQPLQGRRETHQVYIPLSGMSGAISRIEI
eukprot:4286395-Ditylum_brightwellii.AAC.1